MAVHFNFTLEDVDAENIFFALRAAALDNDLKIIECRANTNLTEEQKQSYINWYAENKEYSLGLIKKMTNTRVPE